MNSKAADRIRAMKEKGTITDEQAAELLGALSEEAAEEPQTTETDRAHADEGPARGRGRRRSGAFLDMEWVGDMVDGITTGLGVAADHISGKAGDWPRVPL